MRCKTNSRIQFRMHQRTYCGIKFKPFKVTDGHCIESEGIYQTRGTVFHRDIQTTRRALKIRRAADYFSFFYQMRGVWIPGDNFFMLQVYKRVGISQVEVYKRVGKSVIKVFERPLIIIF